jgi:hypothetical protein
MAGFQCKIGFKICGTYSSRQLNPKSHVSELQELISLYLSPPSTLNPLSFTTVLLCSVTTAKDLKHITHYGETGEHMVIKNMTYPFS